MKGQIFDTSSLPVIPDCSLTHWGERFNGNDDVWKFNDVGRKDILNFLRIKNNYVRFVTKFFLSHYAQIRSLSHVVNFYTQFVLILSDLDDYNLEEKLSEIINKKIIELRNTQREFEIWYLKFWYVWCADVELPFFDSEFAEYLSRIKISGNLKGQAVLSLDLDSGPLNDLELNCLLKLLFNDEDKKEKLLVLLYLTLGCNSRNLSLLKWEDFTILHEESFKLFLLKIPRIKKRKIARSEFRERELDSRVGKVLENIQYACKDEDFIFQKDNGDNYTSKELRYLFMGYISALVVKTDIENIWITPRRLRYTFATQLVMSGASKERLADLLDHTDLQNVQVYYDLRHKIKGFLSEAESLKLKDVYQRFEGKILPSKSRYNEDVKYHSHSEKVLSVGNCSQRNLCELSPPYSCFVCPKFNAFEDSLDSYKKMYADLIEWKHQRNESQGENDKIQNLHNEVISSLSDLIKRIEGKKNE